MGRVKAKVKAKSKSKSGDKIILTMRVSSITLALSKALAEDGVVLINGHPFTAVQCVADMASVEFTLVKMSGRPEWAAVG